MDIELVKKYRDVTKNEIFQLEQQLEKNKFKYNLWDNLINYYNKKWFAHIKFFLNKEDRSLKEIANTDPNAYSLIKELEKEASDVIANQYQSFMFPKLFQEKCENAKLDIDSKSRHPRYRVCNSFIEVEISEKTFEARISDREGILEKLPFDIDAIIEVVKKHKTRLFDRKSNPKSFIKQIYNQYKEIIKKEKLNYGDSIPIRTLMKSLSKKQNNFRADEFIIDFSKIIKENFGEIDGFKLELQQTKDERNGILLYGLESGGYVGFIIFRKVNKQ